MRILILLIAAITLLPGCVSTPGSVREEKAQLDGERQILVEPGWLPNGTMYPPLRLGGFWSDKHPETFFLDVYYSGPGLVEAVKVSIDGDILSLGPDGSVIQTTKYERAENGRRYVVPITLVERLVSSTNAVFQASVGGEKTEGVFKGGATTARKGFAAAWPKIQAARQTHL